MGWTVVIAGIDVPQDVVVADHQLFDFLEREPTGVRPAIADTDDKLLLQELLWNAHAEPAGVRKIRGTQLESERVQIEAVAGMIDHVDIVFEEPQRVARACLGLFGEADDREY